MVRAVKKSGRASAVVQHPPVQGHILDVAIRLFTQLGYEETSTNRVASEAAVSKATVYKLYPSKEDLLVASIVHGCERSNVQLTLTGLERESLPDALFAIACRFMDAFWSESGVHLLQLVISESRRSPRIGASFMKAGPGYIQQFLTEFLGQPARAGQLFTSDPELAAARFISQLGGLTHLALLTSQRKAPKPKERDEHACALVKLFLRERPGP